MKTSAEKYVEGELNRCLRELGESEAGRRFLNKYGSLKTRCLYAWELSKHFRWLGGKGVPLGLDELVTDNLRCVFESKPTDVRTKRRHNDWLDPGLFPISRLR